MTDPNEYSGDVDDWDVIDNFDTLSGGAFPDKNPLGEQSPQERIGSIHGDRAYPAWIRCPSCKSSDVAVWANYDRLIGFVCRSCGRYDIPTNGERLTDE